MSECEFIVINAGSVAKILFEIARTLSFGCGLGMKLLSNERQYIVWMLIIKIKRIWPSLLRAETLMVDRYGG